MSKTVSNIAIDIDNDHLSLNTKNEIDSHPRSGGGLGIENVKKRLDLIYGDHYSLKGINDDDIYEVNLKINLGQHGL